MIPVPVRRVSSLVTGNRAGRARLVALLVLVLVGAGGVVLGLALGNSRFGYRFARFFHKRPGMEMMSASPGDRRAMMVRRMTETLSLTPEQAARVDSAMARREPAFRALMDEMRPRFDSLANGTRAEIDSILTPEQRTRAKKFGEGRGWFGDGRPGGPMRRGAHDGAAKDSSPWSEPPPGSPKP